MKITAVHEEVWRQARERPRSVAIASAAGELSYGELIRRADALAASLAAAGVQVGDRVGVLVDDPVQVVVALLALWRTAAVFEPFDPAAPDRWLAEQAAQAPPAWLLTDRRTAERGEELAATVGARRLDMAAPTPEDGPPAGLAGRQLGPDDPCYVYFTSGSTGHPKAIVGRFKAVGHFIGWEVGELGLGPGSRVSQLTAVGFDAFLRDVFAPLASGGTLCVPPERSTLADGASLVVWLEAARVEVVHCVPSLFRQIIALELGPDRLPDLRWVLLSGEVLLPADVDRWRALVGDRVELINLYGPSETTMTKLFHRVRPEDADAPSVPIGRPMPGARVVVVDDGDRPAPPGRPGEILIRTPYRSLGYHGRPDLNREVFVPNPFGDDPDDLVYRTGDLGRVRDDGLLEFLGRRDAQVKVRGARVELSHVEEALRRELPGVDLAVVDRRDAAGETILVAYLAAAATAVGGDPLAPLAPEELRRRLATRLPPVMVPSAFVRLDALPRTLSGKVDRKALPEPSRGGDATTAPRTQTEQVIAGVWRQVLSLDEVGAGDDFFALGGHSLLATRAVARLNEAFGVELRLADLFETPALSSLARRIDASLRRQGGRSAPPLEPVDRDRALPLTHVQRALWLAYELDPRSSAYNMPLALALDGELDVGALAAALEEIVRRHEVLRTVFRRGALGPEQRVLPPAPLPFPAVDLSALAAERAATIARRLVARLALEPFDVERGPVLRAALIRLGGTEHQVVVCLHHLVGDGLSLQVFWREMAALYEAFRAGRPSPLAELPIQYGDYAAWQRSWLDGPVLDAHLDHWRERLGGVRPQVLVPHDRVPETGENRAGASLGRRLVAESAQALTELARSRDVTLFMALLAVLWVVLARVSGRRDLVVGTDLSNRDRVATEGLIGFFVNQVVLRGDLAGDPRFVDLLDRARGVTLEAFAHGDLPYDRLVAALGVRDGSGASELFQVKLVLQAPTERDGAVAGPAGLSLRSVGIGGRSAKGDLLLEVSPLDDGLALRLDHDGDRFEPATISALLDQLERVVELVVERPERRLSSLVGALDEAERAARSAERSGRRKAGLGRLKKPSRVAVAG